MKIYTKTGDDGTTGLFSGKRVSKADLRVEVYGTSDELNAIIGIAQTMEMPKEMSDTFQTISAYLFELGADFATPMEPTPKFEPKRIMESDIKFLEDLIDEYTEQLPPLRHFVLPGGTKCAAFLHQARTVCRRVERLAVRLAEVENIGEFTIKFVNRLSDFLFVASRMANHLAGIEDVKWIPKK